MCRRFSGTGVRLFPGAKLFLFLCLFCGLSVPARPDSSGGMPSAGGVPSSVQDQRSEAAGRPLRWQPPAASEPNREYRRSASDYSRLSIPGVDKDLTQYYIRQYSSPGGLSWLASVMKRGEPYLYFIRREIESRGLPQELVYLPVIESAYLGTALSKSGAAGLWQFMKNSIAPFDMRVTDWMDERRDFWKASSGALKKLEENYNYLGDWALALAAYNAGLGAISRSAERAGSRDYWALCEKGLLKTETIHYVPKFLAVAHILSSQRMYGMETIWSEDAEWTRIPVRKQTDLELLAREAGMDKDELLRANQELSFGITPPGEGYYLKVRSADAARAAAVLEREDISLINYYFHTVRSGDTLSALARHYGITVDQILDANPGTQARFLKLGSRLLIPALKEAGPYRRAAEDRALVFEGNHLVKRGETLWSIALAYDTDPETLAEANGMRLNDTLREGRSLKTPIIVP